MNIGVRICFLIIFLIFLDRYSGVVFLDHMVVLFFIFCKSPCFFHSGYTNLHSHQQRTRALFSLHPHEDLLFFTVWHDNYRDRCEIISHCNFDCILLMISNVKQLFMSLLAICIFSSERYSFSPSTDFLTVLLACLMLSCMNSLYILDINPLSDILFTNKVSHSVCGLVVLLIAPFAVQKIFSLMKSYLSILIFVSLTWEDISKKL